MEDVNGTTPVDEAAQEAAFWVRRIERQKELGLHWDNLQEDESDRIGDLARDTFEEKLARRYRNIQRRAEWHDRHNKVGTIAAALLDLVSEFNIIAAGLENQGFALQIEAGDRLSVALVVKGIRLTGNGAFQHPYLQAKAAAE